MAENDIDDIELPVVEDDKAPVLQNRPPTPARCVANAAIEAALSDDVRARLLGDELLNVVFLVPGPSWTRPIKDRLEAMLPGAWMTFERDGSSKLHRMDTGNDEVASAVAKGRSVLGVAVAESALPSALVTMADIVANIRTPDESVVARAIGLYLGEVVDPALALSAPGLDFFQLCAAFRPGSNVTQIIDRIRRAQMALTVHADENIGDLQLAVEYGAARDWGLALANDLKLHISGLLPWHEVDHSAIIFGPPGLGKTTYARMLARHMGANLVITSIADLFANGSGYLDSVIKNIDATYQKALAEKPSLVVWDELEALPSRVGLDSRSASVWTPAITKFMLVVSSEIPMVAQIGITNFKEKLDPALLRPGRFGTHLELTQPDEAGIASILRSQLREDLLGADLTHISRVAADRTAAQLMDCVRKARRLARTAGRPLRLADLQDALIPPDAMPAADLLRIATHEAGHVVVGLELGFDEVIHAAIGGLAGAHGQTMMRPSSVLETAVSLEARATVMLAGRTAEIVALGGPPIVGSSADLEEATNIMGEMIMTEGLGGFLVSLADRKDVRAVLRVDRALRAEVESRLQRLSSRAFAILMRRRAAVEAIAAVLAESRFVSGDDARRIFDASAVVSVKADPGK